METTNKYYTPTIEELHDGFEIELNGKGVEGLNWFKRIVQPDEIVLYAMYIDPRRMSWFDVKMGIVPKPEHNIRVKYLDKEDIESLGWEYVEDRGMSENYGYSFLKEVSFLSGGNAYYKLRYWTPNNRLRIEVIGSPTFDGTIKNKSELKVLLKQLGID